METVKMKIRWSACIAIIIIAQAIVLPALAQQKPHYTQYVLNNYILNPAFSGIDNYTDIKLSHRHQWVGIDGAPVTTYFTVSTPLGKKDYKTTATSFDVAGENPLGKQYWQDYEASPSHHGVGMQLISDKFGPFTNFTAQATYAYHLGLSARTNIAGGFGVGLSSYTLNPNKLYFGEDYPVDPAVSGSNVIGRTNFDISAGLLLYSANYFVGLSAQQLMPGKLDFSGAQVRENSGKLVPHFFGTAGYRFLVGNDFNLVPSLMVKSIPSLPIQVDINAKLQYRDLMWAALSYRTKYGFAAFLGVHVLNGLTVSYAYDYSTTKIHTVSSGSHEILLGFMIGNKYSSNTCPRNVW